MALPDFEQFVASLEAHGVRYLIVGAHAIAVHARARYTKDLDIFIDRTKANAARVDRAIEAFFGTKDLGYSKDDLLPQDIRLDLLGDGPLGVIDWEYASLGDPAYDLAIVPRGVRRPLGDERGRERLVDAYSKRRGRRITVREAPLYELCLLARWYAEVRRSHGARSPHAQQQRTVLRGALSRARRA